MKRFFSMFLLFSLLFSLIACSAGDSSVSGKSGEDSQDNSEFDLMGYVCQVFYASDGNSVLWYKKGTLQYDEVKKHLEKIENKYNCTLNIVDCVGDQDEILHRLAAEAAANLKSADWVAVTQSDTILTLASSSMLLPLDEFDVIGVHNTELYGPENIMEAAIYENRPYLLTDYAHPFRQLVVQSILVYNDGLLEKTSGIDLRAVNESKKWTWEYFEQYLKDNAVKENGETVLSPFCVTQNGLAEMALVSNGFSLAIRNDDGTYQNGVSGSNVVDAINWYKRIASEYKNEIAFTTQSLESDKLLDKTALMCMTQLHILTSSIQYSLDKYGLLPYPCGPAAEYGKTGSDPEIYGFGISVNAEEPDQSAVLLRAYCEPFEEYPTVDDAMRLYQNMVFDSRDLEVLTDLVKYSRTRWWGGKGIGKLSDVMVDSRHRDKSAYELISLVEPVLQRTIDKYIIPSAEYTEQYFTK